MKIGIDLGGTKIEVLVIDDNGQEHYRQRIATPKGNYINTISAIANVCANAETAVGITCTVGVSMPGSFSPKTGYVRNANSTWLNDQAFDHDLQTALKREIRFANDANCLAVSEATDGAGAGYQTVFAIILGTGVGGGLAINAKVVNGRNFLAGEWGHVTLPYMNAEEFPGPECFCGQRGCIETYLSGTGFQHQHFLTTGQQLTGEAIINQANSGEPSAQQSLNQYKTRLAKSLAMLANIIDPDIFVLGGGMSNINALYEDLNQHIEPWVLGKEFITPVKKAQHGDSSGVRGAAWLWID